MLTFQNFTIPLFLKWFGLLRTNPPLVPFKIETTSFLKTSVPGLCVHRPDVEFNLIKLLLLHLQSQSDLQLRLRKYRQIKFESWFLRAYLTSLDMLTYY